MRLMQMGSGGRRGAKAKAEAMPMAMEQTVAAADNYFG